MKTLVIISLLSLGSFIANAQQAVAPNKTTSSAKKNEKAQTSDASLRTDDKSSKQTYDHNDPYLGRGEKIKSFLKSGEIPASFPVYIKETSVESYKVDVLTWIQANKDLVKDEAYEKLQSKF